MLGGGIVTPQKSDMMMMNWEKENEGESRREGQREVKSFVDPFCTYEWIGQSCNVDRRTQGRDGLTQSNREDLSDQEHGEEVSSSVTIILESDRVVE